MRFEKSFDITIVGGGMITEMQILPSIYHLQRLEAVNSINICALNASPLRTMAENKTLHNAFPGRTFKAYPDYEEVSDSELFPELYKDVIAKMAPRNIVFIALPDHMHFKAIVFALENDQHVLCVKPLTLKHDESIEIQKMALKKGLFVGVEYHKRFDDRVGMARQKYRDGALGEFRMGYATLIEPWWYRHSNFQNWCTSENSDMFTYIGCHYIDQVHLITGLFPTRVSLYGAEETYPNGNKGYLWTNARVIWENGASLAVLNGMGYPNVGAGGNSQGIWMFTQGENDGGLIFHDDQYRGVKHSYLSKGDDPGESYYNEPSPDYFKLIERGGKELTPVGYGYRSIEGLVQAVNRVESAAIGHSDDNILGKFREMIEVIDKESIVATPANSSFNELVVEAGRLSIVNQAREVEIKYGASPTIQLKEY